MSSGVYAMNNRELHAVTLIWHRVKCTLIKGNIVYLSRSGLGSVAFDVNAGCHGCDSAHNRITQTKRFPRLNVDILLQVNIS